MKRIVIMMMFLSFILLIGCQSTTRPSVEGDFGLLSIQDKADLERMIAKSNDAGFSLGGMFRDNFLESTDDSAPKAQFEDNSGSTDYTKTNVQVEGVDEGDIVKTDGRRIYSIQHNTLRVINIVGGGDMVCVLYDELQSDQPANTVDDYYYYDYTYFSELYVTEDYLVIIGTRYQNSYTYYEDSEGNTEDDRVDSIEPSMGRYYWFVSTTLIRIYDIESLEVVDEYEISGYTVTSRLIDNRLYVVNQHYVYRFNEEYDIRPWIRHQDDVTYVPYQEIKYLENQEYRSFTVISAIILADEISYESDVFLGPSNWGQVYVNQNAIYFASTFYWMNFWGTYKQQSVLISYLINPDTGRVHFGGMGTFQGYIINQFAMDEHNGFMRIVTTEGWGSSAKNRLYVYERKLVDEKYRLEVVGLIDEGLGKPNETVHSARFQGDRATVVTFEQIDPFYTIDLSDPYNPTISGALEIPGVSVYQHPWKENYVIGIGFDEITASGRGMKLSLFDISDFENPVEVGSPLILTSAQGGWAYSQALYNHKSILVDESRGFLGFSLWRSNWTNGRYSSMNDYLLFDIDDSRAQPIQIKHAISHVDYFETNREDYLMYWMYQFTIDRAVRVDDYLYVISGEVITSHNLIGDFNTIDVIIFKELTK